MSVNVLVVGPEDFLTADIRRAASLLDLEFVGPCEPSQVLASSKEGQIFGVVVDIRYEAEELFKILEDLERVHLPVIFVSHGGYHGQSRGYILSSHAGDLRNLMRGLFQVDAADIH